MDGNLKWCYTSSSLLRPCRVDRLTSLPYDLLSRILSMLPTKDAAATQVLSKRMRQAFCWVSSVDLDDSPLSYCVQCPHLVERFSLFESFIDNVLHKLSQTSLTQFRLHLGRNKTILIPEWHKCEQACFPNPEPTHLYAWISYPLAHSGLRELDLSFHVRNPAECKLPPGLFTRQSLEVLRLDSNLEINGGAEFSLICLPNLKLLHLRSFEFTEDCFVTRLVSSCPALEDLSITCWWLKAGRLIISSHSLRRFVFNRLKYYNEDENSDLVFIDTPNLQYFEYTDNLPVNYSVAHLNALVEARIDIVYPLQRDTLETSFRIQLSLARALSNVQHLSLQGCSVEGLFAHVYGDSGTCVYGLAEDLEASALEVEGWRKTQTIPSCCQSHLKRIVISQCCYCDQELNMIKFLLGNVSFLKEFVICLSKTRYGVQFDAADFYRFKKTLEELPRASKSCSIIYRNDESTFL
ncbi:hypothetical protein RND81_10G063400 [Saponaria officinalis]|uniref:F-box domain-containing protein n=1 Tax=Saponaria officinalis TaxID=3572 RepID=A0AAW1HYN8_SAPOF